MRYEDLLQRIPENRKETSVLQFTGAKPNGKILLGFGVACRAGEEAQKTGARRALCVADRVITAMGLHESVCGAVRDAGLSVEVFDRVDAEPDVECARSVQAAARAGGFDLIIGIGGGSTLDMAKTAALSISNHEDILRYLTGTPFDREGAPTILLPTTSGTGSEASPFLVVRDGAVKRFVGTPFALATVALVDPLLTVSMPPKVTAATGLDALAHGVEGSMAKRDPFTEALALQCVELVFRHLPRAFRNGEDLEARYFMSFASVLGMMAYTQGGGLYAHSISYILTTALGLPHGVGCGMALPYTLMLNEPFIRDLLCRWGRATDGPEDGGETVRRFHELLGTVGIPAGLRELGADRDMKTGFVRDLLGTYARPRNPGKMDAGDAEAVFEAMWNGTPDRLRNR